MVEIKTLRIHLSFYFSTFAEKDVFYLLFNHFIYNFNILSRYSRNKDLITKLSFIYIFSAKFHKCRNNGEHLSLAIRIKKLKAILKKVPRII